HRVSDQLTDIITDRIMACFHANDQDSTGREHDAAGRFTSRGEEAGSQSKAGRSVALASNDAIRSLVNDARKTEYGSRGSMIGAALGFLAGGGAALTMSLAPGTSKAVRILKKLTETPSVRPGAWSPRQVTLAGAGLGSTAGAVLG